MSGHDGEPDQCHSQGKKSLLTLPLEMFERFAELCDPSDLLALRLVSRDAAKKVKRTFIRAQFSERAVLITRRRLSRATWIAKHPDFGSALQTLLIRLDDINEQEAGVERRHLRSKKYKTFAASSSILPIETLSVGGKRVQKYTGKSQLLVDYFSALSQNAQVKNLSLWEADGHHYDTEGVRDAPEKVFLATDAKLVFDALRDSDLAITGLGIGFDGFGRPSKLKEFLKPWPVIFAKLQSLRMNAYCFTDLGRKFLDIAETIAELPQLRELELIQDNNSKLSPRDDLMSRIFSGNFPSLEKLCLCSMPVRVDELKKFLQYKSSNVPLKAFIGQHLYISGLSVDPGSSTDELREKLVGELSDNNGLIVELGDWASFDCEALAPENE